MSDEQRELTAADFARVISRTRRARIAGGTIQSGDDVVAVRRFVGLTPARFARALGVDVKTLRSWESGRTRPEGSALALLRIAVRHPKVVRENVASAA